MKLIIQDLLKKTVEIKCKKAETVEILKKRILKHHGVDPQCYCLTFGENILEDDKKLEEYNIKEGSLLFIIFRGELDEFGELKPPHQKKRGVFKQKIKKF